MSEEKTLITHGHDAAKFLGYEVTIAKGEHNKKTKTGATRRVNNGKVLLYVPHDKWVKRLFSYNALKIKYDKQNGNKEVWEPVRRTRLLHLDDLEILNQYNAEIRGLYNYYRLANNVSVLNNFYYVMRYSMLKTFAGKYRTRISRIIRKYRQGKDFVVEYPKKNGKVGKVYVMKTRSKATLTLRAMLARRYGFGASPNKPPLCHLWPQRHCLPLSGSP